MCNEIVLIDLDELSAGIFVLAGNAEELFDCLLLQALKPQKFAVGLDLFLDIHALDPGEII